MINRNPREDLVGRTFVENSHMTNAATGRDEYVTTTFTVAIVGNNGIDYHDADGSPGWMSERHFWEGVQRGSIRLAADAHTGYDQTRTLLEVPAEFKTQPTRIAIDAHNAARVIKEALSPKPEPVTQYIKKPLTPEKVPEHNTFDIAWQMYTEQKYKKYADALERLRKSEAKARTLAVEVAKIPRAWKDRTDAQNKLYSDWYAAADYVQRNRRYMEYWSVPGRLEALRAPTENEKNYYREAYIKAVRKLISSGWDVPGAMIAQYPQFRKAVDARARYEKGWKTSFANVSTAVDRSTVADYGFKVKNQNGTPIDERSIREITQAAHELEAVTGPIKDIVAAHDITVAHTQGFFPFLTSDRSGQYMHGEKTITVGMAGIKAFAHEMAHFLDDASGTKGEYRRGYYHIAGTGDYGEVIAEARRRMNGSDWEIEKATKIGKELSAQEKQNARSLKLRIGYYNNPNEIFARLVEQLASEASTGTVGSASQLADGSNYYHRAPAYWSRETFAELRPRIMEELQRKIMLARKITGTTPQSFGGIYAIAERTPEVVLEKVGETEGGTMRYAQNPRDLIIGADAPLQECPHRLAANPRDFIFGRMTDAPRMAANPRPFGKLPEKVTAEHSRAYHEDAARQWETKIRKSPNIFLEINPAKEWLEKNAEYGLSVDPSIMCVKSLGVDAGVHELKMNLGDAYDVTQAWDLRTRALARGLPVGCPYCYVFSARAKSGVKMQKPYVEGVAEYRGDLHTKISPRSEEFYKLSALRHFSSGDFVAESIPGLIHEFLDAAEMGIPCAGYTKQPDFLRVFGDTGIYIDLSTGRNAEIGLDPVDIKKLRARYPHASSVYISFNDKETLWALRQPWVDHIIPWHMSEQPVPEMLKVLQRDPAGMKFFGPELKDYTFAQTEKYKGRLGETGKLLKVKKNDPLKIHDWEHGGNLAAYIGLCEKRKFVKKFPEIYDALPVAEKHLYMKLIGPEYGQYIKGGVCPAKELAAGPCKIYKPVKTAINYAAIPEALKNRKEDIKRRDSKHQAYLDIAWEIIAEARGKATSPARSRRIRETAGEAVRSRPFALALNPKELTTREKQEALAHAGISYCPHQEWWYWGGSSTKVSYNEYIDSVYRHKLLKENPLKTNPRGLRNTTRHEQIGRVHRRRH